MSGTKTVFHRWIYAPTRFRRLVALYPPLLGAGIRIPSISDDWTVGEVNVRVYPWTANVHGAAFGGSLFSATDVLYGMMLAAQLGRGFEVWTRSATIDFIAPGRGKLTLRVELPHSETAEIRDRTEREGTSEAVHQADIIDAKGEVVATAHHTMRIRARRQATTS